MATKKRRTPARTSKAKPDNRIPILLAAGFVCAILLVVGGIVGLSAAWNGIKGMDEFLVRPGDVSLESDWIRRDAFTQALYADDASGFLSSRVSIFSSDLAQRIAHAYERSPWVREVHSVRRVFPNKIEVDLELREPYAVIQQAGIKDSGYVVDKDGVVIDPKLYHLSWDRLKTLMPLLVIHNNPPVEPPTGQVWSDGTVMDGLRMLDIYHAQLSKECSPGKIEIRPVTQANGLVYSEASFLMGNGASFHWGRVSSVMGSTAEVSSTEKAAKMLAILNKEGKSLGPAKIYDLRVRDVRVR
jgi:hypothetical protein